MFYCYVRFSQIENLNIPNVIKIDIISLEDDTLTSYSPKEFIEKSININNCKINVHSPRQTYYLNSTFLYLSIEENNS